MMNALSPLRIAAGVTVLVLTTAVACVMITTRVMRHGPLPLDLNNTLLITTSLAWVCYIAAHCRDSVVRSIEHRLGGLEQALANYGDARSAQGHADGHLEALRATMTHDRTSTHLGGGSPVAVLRSAQPN